MTTTALPARAGWLRSMRFDVTFILGTSSIALGSVGIVVLRPELFGPVLVLDLWLLAYQHVIATYTRLCFDLDSAREHRFLLVQLPPLVVVAVVLIYFTIGAWAIASIYFYWQWWHYTRQSYGVGQIYKRKAPVRFSQSDALSKAAIYLPPLWGIIHRSNQAPDTFLGLDIGVVVLPQPVEMIAATAATLAVAGWTLERIGAARRGEFSLAHTLYMITHWTVFTVGYVVIANIDAGWLALNVWHNAQYVLFVWLFNTNRFRSGIDPRARFLSTISQRRMLPAYFGTLVVIAGLVYLSTSLVIDAVGSGLPLLVLVYQAVNFHHYIVDSRIWKVRKKPMQQTLRLKTIDEPT